MPTDKQRRAAAQRRLARQLAARQERARRQRRTALIGGGSAAAVVVVVILILVFATNIFSGGSPAAVSSSSTATATAPATASPFAQTTFPTSTAKPQTTSGPCKYAQSADLLASPYTDKVGLPPDPNPTPSTGTVTVNATTSQGNLTFTLDRSKAPCAVQSFVYLAGKGVFNETSCPRLTTSGIYVLQCGDPSNTQGGGPAYQYKEEVSSSTDYSAGVIAMANSSTQDDPTAPTTGSQFFIIYKDSNSGLGKNYSVIGTVSAGMDVVQKVAAGGSDNSNAQGDGTPLLGMTFTKVTVGATSSAAPSSGSTPTGSGSATSASTSAPSTTGAPTTSASG
jgi:peptidyl-prolyl cis-trans isomerase B (cyclophilin B)